MTTRLLDDSYAPEVRDRVILLTVTRTVMNSVYRFAPPFLATIASGLGVSLGTIGVALSITELGGFLAPVFGRLVDGWPRKAALLIAAGACALGAGMTATAPGIVMFTIGLVVLAQGKVVFDLTLNAWLADHVAYARRARVIGLVEMSWAGGLLVGVPVLGLVTAGVGWRWAYGLGGLAVMTIAARLSLRMDGRQVAPTGPSVPTEVDAGRWWVRSLPVFAAFATLMGGAQCGFVTFGSWLEDVHGAGPAGLAAVAFGLGAVELVASSSTMRLTDRIGKKRSVMSGAALMVPAGIALAATVESPIGVGVALLSLYFLGFEFAVVSMISLASNLAPGRAGTALGAIVGAGTVGRAVVAVVATRLYETHGFSAPMLLGAGLGLGTVAVLTTARQVS